MLSENQAKLKWCPHARMANKLLDNGNIHRWVSGYNRNELSCEMPACIASVCMAWRWASEKKLRDIDLVTEDIEKTERLGYCGLSGKSEYGD